MNISHHGAIDGVTGFSTPPRELRAASADGTHPIPRRYSNHPLCHYGRLKPRPNRLIFMPRIDARWQPLFSDNCRALEAEEDRCSRSW